MTNLEFLLYRTYRGSFARWRNWQHNCLGQLSIRNSYCSSVKPRRIHSSEPVNPATSSSPKALMLSMKLRVLFARQSAPSLPMTALSPGNPIYNVSLASWPLLPLRPSLGKHNLPREMDASPVKFPPLTSPQTPYNWTRSGHQHPRRQPKGANTYQLIVADNSHDAERPHAVVLRDKSRRALGVAKHHVGMDMGI